VHLEPLGAGRSRVDRRTSPPLVIVALVTPFPIAGAAGGVKVATLRLARELRRQGVAVTVVALGGGGSIDWDLPLVRLETDGRWSGLRDLRPIRRQLAHALDRLQPDIVHAQELVPAGYAAVRVASAGRPTVVTAHGNRRRDTFAAYNVVGGSIRWLFGRRMALRATQEADAVVVVHPNPRLSLPVTPARIEFIPNIVDEHYFSAVRRSDGLRVLYCGGLRAIKGFDLLLAAWARVIRELPNARLLAPGCQDGLDAMPPDVAARVEALPWLDAAALADVMASSSLVVLPSRFDVAPIAMSEAWAARVPVVAAAVGGIPELAQGAAAVVEPDPQALAAAILSVLNGGDAQGEMVREGFRRVQLQRAERVAAAHGQLYESLLAGR
jgi:glycosyltransferase involved in cell wall biosynthesis